MRLDIEPRRFSVVVRHSETKAGSLGPLAFRSDAHGSLLLEFTAEVDESAAMQAWSLLCSNSIEDFDHRIRQCSNFPYADTTKMLLQVLAAEREGMPFFVGDAIEALNADTYTTAHKRLELAIREGLVERGPKLGRNVPILPTEKLKQILQEHAEARLRNTQTFFTTIQYRPYELSRAEFDQVAKTRVEYACVVMDVNLRAKGSMKGAELAITVTIGIRVGFVTYNFGSEFPTRPTAKSRQLSHR
ncbi:hypothetical protein ACQR10_27365 [Bradyrhizobium sp. HKCCYLRH2060]|uniref:hypothetical protein n=1 Tax=Bradyrhizobium TaxID=374 RepID=UPI0029168CAD|nr:hypothetical protein [Bradyrhizobium sp. SZCCHNR3003]